MSMRRRAPHMPAHLALTAAAAPPSVSPLTLSYPPPLTPSRLTPLTPSPARDEDFLLRVRRWPPVMVRHMADFLALQPPGQQSRAPAAAAS